MARRTFAFVAWGFIACTLLAGCATVDVVPAESLNGEAFVPGEHPIAHVRVANWGWYLFKFIPLATGDLQNPGHPRFPRFFTDNVSTADVVRATTAKAAELGGTITGDIRSTDKSAWHPWSLVLWLNEYEASANVSIPETARDAGRRPGTSP